MEFRIVLIFYYVLLFYQETESSVTVEKGGRATLTCPGFVPSPGNEKYAIFLWYKARMTNHSELVAVNDKQKGASNVKGDLNGRANIDETGVLEIPTTRVTDDHYYTCWFRNTGSNNSGTILNETQLIITVTPAPKDLKIFGSDTVEEGKTITYTCKASEVKPPPQQMYFRFKDDEKPFATDLIENITNADNLTSTVSVENTLIAKRTHQGKKLQCVFVTSTNKSIISSEVREIQVLYKPVGTPSILANKKSTKVNSTMTLTCDTKGVDGSITSYLWFANGTEIKNTTKITYEYTVTSVGKVNFTCISGNSIGNTHKSQPLEVEITNIANENPDKGNSVGGNSMLLGIIGGCVGAAFLGLAVGCFLWRRKKKKENSPGQQQSNNVEEPPVVYAEVNKNRGARRGVANGGQADAAVDLGGDVYAQPMKKKGGKNKAPQQNGEYGNLELGEGRAMSEDGLIYATPDFAKPPPTGKGKGKNQGAKAPSAQAPPAGQAAKTSQPNKHMDYTPVEYGELNFTQMKK